MQANEPKGKATRSSATKPPESSSTVSMESDVVVVGHRVTQDGVDYLVKV